MSASLNAANKLSLLGADADTAVAVGSLTTPALLGELGLSIGTTQPINLLTQGGAIAGQTLSVTIGGNPATTITFGTGAGNVSTLAELAAALGSVSGGTATLDTTTGNLSIAASSAADTIVVGGTADPEQFGMQTRTGLPSNGNRRRFGT